MEAERIGHMRAGTAAAWSHFTIGTIKVKVVKGVISYASTKPVPVSTKRDRLESTKFDELSVASQPA
jgi:hypothetical protein